MVTARRTHGSRRRRVAGLAGVVGALAASATAQAAQVTLDFDDVARTEQATIDSVKTPGVTSFTADSRVLAAAGGGTCAAPIADGATVNGFYPSSMPHWGRTSGVFCMTFDQLQTSVTVTTAEPVRAYWLANIPSAPQVVTDGAVHSGTFSVGCATGIGPYCNGLVLKPVSGSVVHADDVSYESASAPRNTSIMPGPPITVREGYTGSQYLYIRHRNGDVAGDDVTITPVGSLDSVSVAQVRKLSAVSTVVKLAVKAGYSIDGADQGGTDRAIAYGYRLNGGPNTTYWGANVAPSAEFTVGAQQGYQWPVVRQRVGSPVAPAAPCADARCSVPVVAKYRVPPSDTPLTGDERFVVDTEDGVAVKEPLIADGEWHQFDVSVGGPYVRPASAPCRPRRLARSAPSPGASTSAAPSPPSPVSPRRPPPPSTRPRGARCPAGGSRGACSASPAPRSAPTARSAWGSARPSPSPARTPPAPR